MQDLQNILDQSLQWGASKARETRWMLLAHCARIAQGISLGHKRADIPTQQPTLYVVEKPFVIAYNPETRIVLRILHGRRDLARLFGL